MGSARGTPPNGRLGNNGRATAENAEKWTLDCFSQILNKRAVLGRDRAIKDANASSVHLRENHKMVHLTWSSAFRGRKMPVSAGTQHVRVGGNGPAVLLLHGFGDTADMWVPLAEVLHKDHTVVVPDLRVGLSSHPEGGYEKTGQVGTLP
jgi:hypothetical protein